MKNLILIALLVFVANNTFAQKQAKYETVVIQTSAECGQCKERIEETMNYTKGVKFAELDLETMKLTVKYSPATITLAQLKEKISAIGYDADEVKANKEAYDKLPACCKVGGMEHEEHRK